MTGYATAEGVINISVPERTDRLPDAPRFSPERSSAWQLSTISARIFFSGMVTSSQSGFWGGSSPIKRRTALAACLAFRDTGCAKAPVTHGVHVLLETFDRGQSGGTGTTTDLFRITPAIPPVSGTMPCALSNAAQSHRRLCTLLINTASVSILAQTPTSSTLSILSSTFICIIITLECVKT